MIQSQIRGLAVRPTKGSELQERQNLQLTPSAGVVDDHATSSRRQLTILSESQWQTACQGLGDEIPWITRRANMLVSQVEFDDSWQGKTIAIGEVKLLVHGELVPCHQMDEQVNGLQEQLVPDWRGGIYCEVITGGEIGIGDTLELVTTN